jgi:hypothetical protein
MNSYFSLSSIYNSVPSKKKPVDETPTRVSERIKAGKTPSKTPKK